MSQQMDPLISDPSSNNPSSNVYCVCVRSILDEGWVRALEVTPISTHRHYTGTPRTMLTLQLTDQSELLGLLNRLHHMGLTILLVEKGLPNPV